MVVQEGPHTQSGQRYYVGYLFSFEDAYRYYNNIDEVHLRDIPPKTENDKYKKRDKTRQETTDEINDLSILTTKDTDTHHPLRSKQRTKDPVERQREVV